jgi:hypothetical protein
METASHINVIPEQANPRRSLQVLFTPDEKPLLSRLFNAVSNPLNRTQISSVPHCSDDFRFLQSNNAAPVAIRLALELAEAARAIRRDPLAFIAERSDTNPISSEKRKRMRAGVVVAVVFYTLVLSGIYASYSIYHRITPNAAQAKHLEVTYLAARQCLSRKPCRNSKKRRARQATNWPRQPNLGSGLRLNQQRPSRHPRPPDQIATAEPTTNTTTSQTSEITSRVWHPKVPPAALKQTVSGRPQVADEAVRRQE